mmetsp:Transcript_118091/g.252342  ORF Transcript_118091/g.252342 Transcript_118091/m.252342 type:complete len:550 (+) Transcript_118091:30-1679(+)
MPHLSAVVSMGSEEDLPALYVRRGDPSLAAPQNPTALGTASPTLRLNLDLGQGLTWAGRLLVDKDDGEVDGSSTLAVMTPVVAKSPEPLTPESWDPFEQAQTPLKAGALKSSASAPSSCQRMPRTKPPSLAQEITEKLEGCKAEFQKKLRNRIASTVSERNTPSFEERMRWNVRKKRAETQATEIEQKERIAQAVARGCEKTSMSKRLRPASAPAERGRGGSGGTSVGSPKRCRAAERKQRIEAEAERTLQLYEEMLEAVAQRPLLMEGAPAHKDYYDFLGVDPDATVAEIRARFEDLVAAEQLGDSGGDPLRLQKLEMAFSVLSDTHKRQDYDEGLGWRRRPQRNLLLEKIEADIAEKVEQKRQQLKAEERKQLELLKEIKRKGIAKSALSGSHAIKSSQKSLTDLVDEKKKALEAESKEQWAKIRDLQLRGASRERHLHSPRKDPFPTLRKSASSERFDAALKVKMAEKRVEMQNAERSQRQLLRSARERGAARSTLCGSHKTNQEDRARIQDLTAAKKAALEAQSREGWAHIKQIKARAASRERLV